MFCLAAKRVYKTNGTAIVPNLITVDDQGRFVRMRRFGSSPVCANT